MKTEYTILFLSFFFLISACIIYWKAWNAGRKNTPMDDLRDLDFRITYYKVNEKSAQKIRDLFIKYVSRPEIDEHILQELCIKFQDRFGDLSGYDEHDDKCYGNNIDF